MRLPFCFALAVALSAAVVPLQSQPTRLPDPAVGPFFEREQPFFHTQVDVAAAEDGTVSENFVVRGIVVPLAPDHALVFDQELLRVAGFWIQPLDHPPVTLQTMAQMSYVIRRRRAYADHPRPTGPLLLTSAMKLGASSGPQPDFADPRPEARRGDFGRGALPRNVGRFEGVELTQDGALLHYRIGDIRVREWHRAYGMAGRSWLLRHLEIEPHHEPLHLRLGTAAERVQEVIADGADRIRYASNSDVVTLHEVDGEQVATVAPSNTLQRVTLSLRIPTAPARLGTSRPPDEDMPRPPTPPLPASSSVRRWPERVTAPVQLDAMAENGLVMDRIAVPFPNPWERRVRSADIAFLDTDRAAVVTYDGDVWLVDGFADPGASELGWRRYASGLHEPLAIAAPGGVVQVATKNGIVRLHDRDGNGEADWVENFNDQMIQSQTTRSFPLDMAVAPDGTTYVTQGGIVTQSGIVSGGTGTSHAGAILEVSPDGTSARVFAEKAREPFLTVHPKTGMVTGTDQQGHYVPSSVVYLIREGDSYGFLEDNPEKLTPPLVWVPHEQDSASSSQVWLAGEGMGAWRDRLLHLSYGTGRLFLVAPDLEAPTPQGAVIPLNFQTNLPLLHAAMHPGGAAAYLAGFQIWGSRTTTPWALGRLRPGTAPITTALHAVSTADGVILEFASPLAADSVEPNQVWVRAWNYVRSPAYGSGRYNVDDGSPGTTSLGVGQTVLSKDGRSVFVHLPDLPSVMQLEVRHDFRLASGEAARGVVYFTIHAHRAQDLAAAGFPAVDLSQSQVTVARQEEEPPSVAMGKAVAETFGCVACHSAEGTTEGQIGPTWRGLYGATRTFIDGTTTVADELYLREKILDPLRRRVTLTQAEMPSYRGVVSEQQLEALILYIRSLRTPPEP